MKVAYVDVKPKGKGEWGPDGKPKVVLSFGARMPGGATFAQWLREAIRQRKGYPKRDHVYLDTIALQGRTGTTLTIGYAHEGKRESVRANVWYKTLIDGKETSVTTLVNLGHVRETARAGGVAALNDIWDVEYIQAVQSAHTMVLVLTPAWLASPNCIAELRTYVSASKHEGLKTTGGGRYGRQLIVLHFATDPDLGGEAIWYEFLKQFWAVGADGPIANSAKQLRVEREFSVKDPKMRATLTGNMADQWTLTPASLDRLLAEIPTYKHEPPPPATPGFGMKYPYGPRSPAT
jgi:hypothetical protein